MRWLAIFLLAACSWAQSGLPLMGSTGAGVAGGVAPVFGQGSDADTSAAHITIAWTNGAPSAGNGAAVFFWHSTATTVTSVCDGTGTDGCTSSDTFTSLGAYTNTAHFISEIYVMCNLAHTGSINITPNTSTQVYAEIFYFTGQTTGSSLSCVDTGASSNAQSTSATQRTGGALTTTRNDLLTILASNNCGGTVYGAGVDGQGDSMVLYTPINNAVAGVLSLGHFAETTSNTFTPTVTLGPTCGTGGNAQTVAFK